MAVNNSLVKKQKTGLTAYLTQLSMMMVPIHM